MAANAQIAQDLTQKLREDWLSQLLSGIEGISNVQGCSSGTKSCKVSFDFDLGRGEKVECFLEWHYKSIHSMLTVGILWPMARVNQMVKQLLRRLSTDVSNRGTIDFFSLDGPFSCCNVSASEDEIREAWRRLSGG